MRTVIVSLLIAVLGAALGAGAAIYAGLYDVAATSPHWRATSWLLETARTRSIKAQAAWITAPPGLGDPANVILGVGHYAAHCAVCHGAPGVPRRDIAQGLYPPPPDLAKAASLYTPAELFWIIKHRHQDDRHAGLERSQRRGDLGDGRLPRKAAGHERGGLRPPCDGEHGSRRPPRFQQRRQ
ncbi:MAG TPA: cytochrome c [Acidocella sp.]|nr:cytochrome c [Acidocella sp.]